MRNVVLVYSSNHGHTRTVAEHIQMGAASFPGMAAELLEITAAHIGDDGKLEQ